MGGVSAVLKGLEYAEKGYPDLFTDKMEVQKDDGAAKNPKRRES